MIQPAIKRSSKIRVLIADDSAFMRAMLQDLLGAEARIEIAGTAVNGAEAVAQFIRLNPDLVLLDVEMPEINGLEALSSIRRLNRVVPVIMCSSLTQRGVQTTLEALALGATDYVAKHGSHSRLDPENQTLEKDLVPKIMALFPDQAAPMKSHPFSTASFFPRKSPHELELVAIGVSTGGPAALEVLLPQFPADFPVPIVIAQHMPQKFTEQLAIRLDCLCPLRVREAQNGARAEAGIVNIARGDWHLELTPDLRMHVHQRQVRSFCRPSIDLLFHSACAAYSGNVLGVVLTGMGSDGLEGCRAIRSHGGTVFAQDEDSSVVWGMPGSVVHARLAQKVIPLDLMAEEIMRAVQCRPDTRPKPETADE